jgi:hypothetical protein
MKARVRHILAAREFALDDESASVLISQWFCALQLELNSVLNLPWEWQQVAMGTDHTIFWSHGL